MGTSLPISRRMLIQKIRYSCVVMAAALLPSCAQWNEAQKSKLSTVAIAPVGMTAGAYRKPVGAQNIQVQVTGQVGNGSFGQGAAAGALIALGTEIAEAIQQKMFDSRYAVAIAAAPKTLPQDLGKRTQTALNRKVGMSPFFHGRLQPVSPNRMELVIKEYCYVRSGKVGGEIVVRPVIVGQFEVTTPDEKLLDVPVAGIATNHAAPITRFAADASFTSQAFDEAVANLAVGVANQLDAKTGTKTP